MPLFTQEELNLAEAIGSLNYINPFSSERQKQEQNILGRKALLPTEAWHIRADIAPPSPNVERIDNICSNLAEKLYPRLLASPAQASPRELEAYDRLIVYMLFEKYCLRLHQEIQQRPENTSFPFYHDFAKDFQRYITAIPREVPSQFQPEKTFAIYYQLRRAFYHIYYFIIGSSLEAAAFRANIWQSIFTYDIYRYHRLLFDKMANVSTLVTGESGTGKELVARAIALSQYIPLDGKNAAFLQSNTSSFNALQLSAMPQSILESELFGYAKGAYTGAIAEHHGYFETCTRHDSIFLDEIGDISPEVQTKLLRVLQTRSFQRIGEVSPRPFYGKVISATNRNLLHDCQEGLFRSDLYYRLCSDTISTVPLRQLIHGNPDELRLFVSVLSLRILENKEEAASFAEEVHAWLLKHLGVDYPWPGNVREMEQCLRNLLIRGTYTPQNGKTSPASSRLQLFRDCTMTAEQVMKEYMHAVFDRFGNLAQTAQAAGVDRRTAKKYLQAND